MTSSKPQSREWLNIDQSYEELSELYGPKDYYWYLRSEPFQLTFLQPMGALINSTARTCLDVGCGEGQLADFVTIPYIGIDGSPTAVKRGRAKDRNIILGRMENPPHTEHLLLRKIDLIVFGGLLSVLIKPEYRLDFVQMYLTTFSPRYFVVYDLATLDTTQLDRVFTRGLESFQATVDMPDLQEIKRTRKVILYKAQPSAQPLTQPV